MSLISCHKLLITVVQHGRAKEIIKAGAQAGAEGGTIFLGKGTGLCEKKFLGIPIFDNKEIVLTLFPEKIEDLLFAKVVEAGKLRDACQGIALIIDVAGVAGIPHFCELDAKKRQDMKKLSDFVLIITIVNSGNAQTVMDASKEAGAEGGTILCGRGTGIHEQATIFSIPIEPEKDVILTLIGRDQSAEVLQAIRTATDLDVPGRGIAFVLPVERVSGIKRMEPPK